MEQTNYRILKLKNGESLIAGIMPVTKKDVSAYRPVAD